MAVSTAVTVKTARRKSTRSKNEKSQKLVLFKISVIEGIFFITISPICKIRSSSTRNSSCGSFLSSDQRYAELKICSTATSGFSSVSVMNFNIFVIR